ncbi:MAG: hypothetical protein WA771_10040 [Chthoniobacterales bacterium]
MRLSLIFFAFFALASAAHSQLLTASTPSPDANDDVRLIFTPPDLSGRFVLGVFDSSGKLVRRLVTNRDASVFDVGRNGYVTTWDGHDDVGQRCPPGEYSARGYVIGDAITIEGEAYHFNDWTHEAGAASVIRVIGAEPIDPANLVALFETSAGPILERVPMVAGANAWSVPVPGATDLIGIVGRTAQVETKAGPRAYSLDDGSAVAGDEDAVDPGEAPVVPGGRVVDWTDGAGKTQWATVEIDRTTAVVQIGPDEEMLRSLPPDDSGFLPQKISAAPATEAIAVIEERDDLQRVRVLALDSTREAEEIAGRPVSEWQILLERVITPNADFGLVDGEIVASGGTRPTTEIVNLDPNELDPTGRTLKLHAEFDAAGSFLTTDSGLELLRVSASTGLQAVALVAGVEPGTLRFIQGNGAVVEEFLISNTGKIAAFDCGTFTLSGPEE